MNNNAGFFRIENTGIVKYFYEIKSDTSSTTVECKGIHFDDDKGIASILISSDGDKYKAGNLKINGVIDASLFVISEAGTLIRGKHITFARGSNLWSAMLAPNILKKHNDFYIWAGHSQGFETDYQS